MAPGKVVAVQKNRRHSGRAWLTSRAYCDGKTVHEATCASLFCKDHTRALEDLIYEIIPIDRQTDGQTDRWTETRSVDQKGCGHIFPVLTPGW